MNCPENWILILCCSLLSFCLVVIMILMISLLRIVKKITKIFTTILSFINLENKILAPIFILKKIFSLFLQKKNYKDTQDNDNQEDDAYFKEQSHNSEFLDKRKIIKILKCTLLVVSILGLLKNKK